MFYLLIFFLGAALASFFDVVAERSINGSSFFFGRSKCSHCKKKLAWYDLLPVFSWLILRGRCRFCSAKISTRHFFGEVFLGLIFVLVAANYHFFDSLTRGDLENLFKTIFGWFLAGVLFAVFLADLKYFIIPDQILYLWLMGLLLYWPVFLWLKIGGVSDIMKMVLAGFFFGFMFYLVFHFSSGRWLGFGDVKYFFLAGFSLGAWNFAIMIFLASFAGSVVGLWQIVFRGKNLKSKLPFGVFLAPATLLVYLWGEELTEFVLGIGLKLF